MKVVVGNKIDKQREVEKEEWETMAMRAGAVYYETSARTGGSSRCTRGLCRGSEKGMWMGLGRRRANRGGRNWKRNRGETIKGNARTELH